MSNSFNISVKPEIAALETKVDTIDTVVDTIRATDVPNIQTNIDANETKIDLIRGTDVPALDTKLTTIDTVVDSIRATDFPAIQTNIDASETAILAKSDSIINLFKIFPSDDVLHTNAAAVPINSDVWTLAKETITCYPGTIRITFSFRAITGGTGYAKIYVDDTPVGTERSQGDNGYQTYTEDITVDINAKIQIYVKHSAAAGATSTQNLILKGILPNYYSITS